MHSIKMEVNSSQPQNWWIETSRKWIMRAFGDVPVDSFEELLELNIYERKMDFREIAKEWDISLEVLAELVADHIRRQE